MQATADASQLAGERLKDEVASAEAKVIACGRRIDVALGAFGEGDLKDEQTNAATCSTAPTICRTADTKCNTNRNAEHQGPVAPLVFFLVWFGPASGFAPR